MRQRSIWPAVVVSVGLAFALQPVTSNLDTSFGKGDLVRADLGSVDRAMFAVVRPNRKLLVAGTSGVGLVLVRFQP
jgi:hypothetical protein